jgi:hypothetical protein
MTDLPPSFDDVRLENLKRFCGQHEINMDCVRKLRQLEDFEIICLCDDSGSMGTLIEDSNADPFAKRSTRWDELRGAVKLILECATALDKSGVDVYFLNRPPLLNVVSPTQVLDCFQYPPQGYTPTVRVLNQICQARAADLAEKKILLILATDGQPTDDNGNIRLQEFVDFMKRRHQNLYVSICVQTDDEDVVKYLDGMVHHGYPRLEVTDDYRTERKQALGKGERSFTFGDYIAKIMLGPIFGSYDHTPAGIVPGAVAGNVVTGSVVMGSMVAGSVVAGSVVAGNVVTGSVVSGSVVGNVVGAPSGVAVVAAAASTGAVPIALYSVSHKGYLQSSRAGNKFIITAVLCRTAFLCCSELFSYFICVCVCDKHSVCFLESPDDFVLLLGVIACYDSTVKADCKWAMEHLSDGRVLIKSQNSGGYLYYNKTKQTFLANGSADEAWIVLETHNSGAQAIKVPNTFIYLGVGMMGGLLIEGANNSRTHFKITQI